jgi:hypothetical protein
VFKIAVYAFNIGFLESQIKYVKGLFMSVKIKNMDAMITIALADHGSRITGLAGKANITIREAAERYVLACINGLMKTGQYRAYKDAIDAYEGRQVGDTTVYPSRSRKVKGSLRVMREEYELGSPDAYESMLTTERYEREANVDAIIQGYIGGYAETQSPHNTAALKALKADRHEASYICSRSGALDPETRKLHNNMRHLHREWAHNRSLTMKEMLILFRQYLPAGVTPEPEPAPASNAPVPAPAAP